VRKTVLAVERSISGRRTGLVEATLRLRYGKSEAEVRRELDRAFARLFQIYEDGRFEVTITCNAILQGPPSDPTFSLYFGHDYIDSGDEKSVAVSGLYKVHSMDGIDSLPLGFGIEEYGRLFNKTFHRTGVKVVGIANLIYIASKVLGDYGTERKTAGRKHVMLY
jgi:hypothetical protein